MTDTPMPTPENVMRRFRPTFALTCLLIAPAISRADDPIDSVMYREPALAAPKVVLTFPENIRPLWLAALDRPDVETRCHAALAIADAHTRGMPDLAPTAPALIRELERPDNHPAVRVAAARALVALDARDSAPAMAKLLATADGDLREVTEPALARWTYAPAAGAWLERIASPLKDHRGVVLAMQGLAALREEKAVSRLRELVLAPEERTTTRLEAARALGAIRTKGGEADADRLAADVTPRGTVARIAAAWTLRQHSGDEAVRRLQVYVRDSEPAVAAVAVTRLVELDPALVEPVLTPALGSPDANVRARGVEVLSRRPSAAHVVLLGNILSDPHPDVRSRARVALHERAKEPAWLAAVIKEGERVLNGTAWRGKEQAAVLLAQLDHKPAAGRLVELLKDERPEVAIAAAWALRVLAVPETYPAALEHFDEMVKVAGSAEWHDRQTTHLAQMFGQARYAPSEPALRGIIPPKTQVGYETRAAACWALGLMKEGKTDAALARLFAGRLAAFTFIDIEDPRVRRMSAIALGRMKAEAGLSAIRQFIAEPRPSFDPINNACLWAVEQITGEKVPPAGTVNAPQSGWFLQPVGP